MKKTKTKYRDMEENNGFGYVGDVPTVYKFSPYEVYYEPLYVHKVDDKLFFAIKTDKGLEAIAGGKDGIIRLDNNSDTPVHYNAENDRLCAMIPDYKL